MKNQEKIINIPNLLSFYRIIAIPFIIWSLVYLKREIFITLICLNLITDILDGLIARTFKMCTEFGARLDSLADIGTFILSITGFIVFEKHLIMEYRYEFIILFGLYVTGQLLSLIKFSRNTSFHLYSNKFSGYVQGIFIFTYFLYGFNAFYFYFMIITGVLAEIEVILLVIILPNLISNAKSIFLTQIPH